MCSKKQTLMFRPADQNPQDRAPSLLAMVAAVRAQQAPELPASAIPMQPGAKKRGGLLAVVGLTLAGAVAGGVLAQAWPQSYRATSDMMLAPSVQVASSAPGFSVETAQALIEGQLRVLRSGSVLNAAVDKLNLAADNEFNGNDAGPFGLGGALAHVGALVSGDAGSFTSDRRQRAVETLARAVDIQRRGNSAVVSISARSADPEKSAVIANTLTELFLADLGGASASAAAVAKLDGLKADVTAAERAVVAYRSQNGLLASAEEIDLLSEQLAAARARTVALNAQVARARGPGIDGMATGSISPASDTLEDIRVRVTAQKQRVDSLSARLGPRHPELINAQAELASVQRELDAETRRLSSALQGDLASAVREEQDFAARVAQVKDQGEGGDDKLSTLRALERTVELHRAAYDEAAHAADGGQRAVAGAGTRILSVAETPTHSSAPSLPTLSLAGALAGLFAGLGLTGWRRDRKHADPAAPYDTATEFYDDREQWDEAQGDLPEADYHPQEAPAMYPYPPQGPHAAPAQHYGQPDAGYPAAYPQPHPAQAVAPAWYPPAPQHDPWAAQGYGAPAPYAPPGYPQAYPHQPHYGHPQGQYPTVVYVPVAVPPAPQQQAQYRAEQAERHAFIDRRTDAALEEIRQSLRALREAIEDIADDRYGT